ncbi:MAG: hypothetical protein P1V97_02910 [Planctomycetota bacterium]|nr:hypothetical protein [Planctomycetota bacterium]
MSPKDCIKELNTAWVAKGLRCSILGPEHPGQSYTLEFESNELAGTISLWDNGYLDAIILHKDSNKVFNEHYRLKDKSEFREATAEIYAKHFDAQ